MRPLSACDGCRLSKRKCILVEQDKPCKRCSTLRFTCSLVQSSTAPLDSIPPSVSNQSISTTSAGLLPRSDVCNELVDLYFEIIHDKQHALFHRPSFVREQREGKAPLTLVFGMLALAARFSSNPWFKESNRWNRGQAWAAQCKRLFDEREKPVSLMAIQACSLLSILAFTEGDIDSEALYGALALRMVHIMDIPNKQFNDSLQREIEIRVWWTMWMMDNWSSAGARLPRQLKVDPSFPWPQVETTFEKLLPTLADGNFALPLDRMPRDELGLWAQMIPLTEVIAPVNELHESTVQNLISPAQVFERVQTISHKLDSWLLRLPDSLRCTPENMKRLAAVGHGRTLVALHLGFHHHSQLLYYQFLQPATDLTPEQRTLTDTYAARCKEHATALSQLLWLARSIPRCDCQWVIIGHLLVISSSIHLHSLLFASRDASIRAAQQLLARNFEMVMALRQYWPSLDFSMSRLRAFHHACRRSMHTSFSMDHWMLLFLHRYTKAVGNREEPLGLGVDDDRAPPWPDPFPAPAAELAGPLPLQGVTAEPDRSIGSMVLQTFL